MDRRRALLAGTSAPVQVLAGATSEAPPLAVGADLALSHGLFTMLATADETRPALVAIDDLHWCDQPSLEFVLYLLQRLNELPLALVMSRRPGMGGDVRTCWTGLRRTRRSEPRHLRRSSAERLGTWSARRWATMQMPA